MWQSKGLVGKGRDGQAEAGWGESEDQEKDVWKSYNEINTLYSG